MLLFVGFEPMGGWILDLFLGWGAWALHIGWKLLTIAHGILEHPTSR